MVSHARSALTAAWNAARRLYHPLPSCGIPTLPASPGSIMVERVGNVISGGGWVMNWAKPAWALACVLPRLCFVKRERGLPHHLFLESGDTGLGPLARDGGRAVPWAARRMPHSSPSSRLEGWTVTSSWCLSHDIAGDQQHLFLVDKETKTCPPVLITCKEMW